MFLMSRNRAAAEFIAGLRRNSIADAVVASRFVKIRELAPAISAERRKAVVKIVDVGDVDVVRAPAPAAKPRVIPVTGTAREPPEVAETETKSETDAKSNPAAEAEKGDVGGRPH